MSVAGALISLLRGKQFYWQEPEPAPAAGTAAALAATGEVAAAHFAANGRAVRTGDAAGNGEPPPARPATSYAD
jgi:hypothetical protein